MAYIIVPNLSHQSSMMLLQSKDKLHYPPPIKLTSSSSSSIISTTLEAAAAAAVDNKQQHNHRDDFYVNVGVAVRTLRQDLPRLFSKDLHYHIYRDDITFLDPLNTFSGIHNYKLIFWALRFHARILFRDISLEVLRVWQPSEHLIVIRWNLRGVPRLPWEAQQGEFQATSRYKLDRRGKIYQHKVDNLAFNFPPPSVLHRLLVPAPAPTTTPNPTFLCPPAHYSPSSSSSWVDLYRAVKQTLERGGQTTLSLPSPPPPPPLHYIIGIGIA